MGVSNIVKTCFGKTRHETEQQAIKHVEYLYETEGIEFKHYRCPICNGYHLTTKRKRR